MSNQPKTKARSVRVPDDLWQAAQARAQESGETVTAAILRALKTYARTWPGFCQNCGAALDPSNSTTCYTCHASDADE